MLTLTGLQCDQFTDVLLRQVKFRHSDMATPTNVLKLLLGLLLYVSNLAAPCLGLDLVDTTVQSQTKTREIAQLLTDGKLAEAISLQNQIVSIDPTSWLPHATLSYLFWRQGSLLQAIKEGEEAAKLNPQNAVALINLAILKQNAYQYPESLSLYRQATHLAPDSWVPWLGIAKCYIANSDKLDGIKTLRYMVRQCNRSFDWYYLTAKTALSLNELQMAEIASQKAISAAKKTEQKAASENILLLVLLRSNKVAQAKAWQEQVFSHNQPRDAELYTRTALSLIEPNDTSAGKVLLTCAMKNLDSPNDGDGFLRLGRAFVLKALAPSCQPANRDTWLQSARAAFTRATELNPKCADYHLALAGTFTGDNQIASLTDELVKTSSLDPQDTASPFLLTKLRDSNNYKNKTSTIPLNLLLARFKIEGVTCSCHLSKINTNLRSKKGVTCVVTPSRKPYRGILLVDRSLANPRELLRSCGEAIRTQLQTQSAKKQQRRLRLTIVAECPVTNTDQALQVVQFMKFGPLLSFKQTDPQFLNRFNEIAPINPNNQDGSACIASDWPAAL